MDHIVNESELTKLLFEKVKMEDADSVVILGDLCFQNSDYKNALEWYAITDAQNHVDGQYMLGIIYHHGFGVDQDYQRALDYFLKAFENGKATAGTSIGRAYHFGLGVELDYKKAMDYYMVAAKNGDFNAEYFIGLLYEQGDGVDMNAQVALEWYEKSAENGSKEAAISKSRLYDEGYQPTKKQNGKLSYVDISAPNDLFYNKDIELLKIKLNHAKKKLVESENENSQLKKKAIILERDIRTIREMYRAYKEEEEAKPHLKKDITCRLQRGYARIIMNYVAREDEDEDE